MIGGASIIDMMILVIDINKGIQAQTAEVRRPNPANQTQPISIGHFVFENFSVWLSEKLSELILFSFLTKSIVLKKASEKRKSKQRRNLSLINY